jgi:hypothetical protein
MTKCETRKQLLYSRLGTGISQENGGLNQVLRRVKPPTCMTVVNSSVILTNGEGGGIERDKSGKSNSPIVPRIWNSRPSCMICENADLRRIQTKNVIKSDEKLTLNIPIYENAVFVVLFKGQVSFCHHLASVVRRILSNLNLLLWNTWTKLNQTWQGWSLDGSLSKLCPSDPPSIQDGCCY